MLSCPVNAINSVCLQILRFGKLPIIT